MRQMINWGILALFLGINATVHAGTNSGTTKQLAYPSETPSAEGIAEQVFFVNHFYSVKNFFIHRKAKRHISVLASRAKGKKAKINTFRRYLNNDYEDGEIRSRDVALFHSGKLMGTGMLITDYEDNSKSQSYAIWLPALKKLRKFSEPPHDDSWGGTDFTFGDIYLRKPQHETHELLGTTIFSTCLEMMPLTEKEKRHKYLRQLHTAQCGHKGKKAYQLKSTHKTAGWWYDYRISYVDSKTFADYRVEYYKNGKRIKLIDKDWLTMRLDDPRGVYWRYMYAKNFETGHESVINVPDNFVSWNKDEGPELWTEEALKHMRK